MQYRTLPASRSPTRHVRPFGLLWRSPRPPFPPRVDCPRTPSRPALVKYVMVPNALPLDLPHRSPVARYGLCRHTPEAATVRAVPVPVPVHLHKIHHCPVNEATDRRGEVIPLPPPESDRADLSLSRQRRVSTSSSSSPLPPSSPSEDNEEVNEENESPRRSAKNFVEDGGGGRRLRPRPPALWFAATPALDSPLSLSTSSSSSSSFLFPASMPQGSLPLSPPRRSPAPPSPPLAPPPSPSPPPLPPHPGPQSRQRQRRDLRPRSLLLSSRRASFLPLHPARARRRQCSSP